MKRLYHGSDAEFLNLGNNCLPVIKTAATQFANFSPRFTPDMLQQLETKLEEVGNVPSDQVFVDIQAKTTEQVEVQMGVCGKLFQNAKFSIEMAFPNDRIVWNQFGYNDYAKARMGAKYMYLFLTDFHMVAERYKVQLVAEGWDDARFAGILTQRDKLKAAMDNQNQAIMDRAKAAEQRIEKLNEVYEILALYFKAARIIFADNEEMLKYFRFPERTTANNELEEEVVEQEAQQEE